MNDFGDFGLDSLADFQREWQDELQVSRTQLGQSRGKTNERLRDPDSNVVGKQSKTTKSKSNARKFIIGLDYGTTFTAFSYFFHDINDKIPMAFEGEVKSIENWPLCKNLGSTFQVPTESKFCWYPAIPLRRYMGEDEDHERLGEKLYNSRHDIHPLTVERSQKRKHFEDSDDEFERSMDGDGEDEEDKDEEDEAEKDEEMEFLWGYPVHDPRNINSDRSKHRLVRRPKLGMLNTPWTRDEHKEVRAAIKSLIQEGSIRKFGKPEKSDVLDSHDLIVDFLVKALQHVEKELIRLHGFSRHCPVEFAITVPVMWSPKCSRILSGAVEDAIRATGFGARTNEQVPFIISEPEAAATYLLQGNNVVLPGETLIIADCGGGTVDVVTYGVERSFPLRLSEEKFMPSGDNCGSSYLNDNYRKHLESRLRDETYLLNNDTLESIINTLIPDFENDIKRRVNTSETKGNRRLIPLLGLKGDDQMARTIPKRFRPNKIILDNKDFKEIFDPLLFRVQTVIHSQLSQAFQMGLYVKKVFLIGGFGESPSLRSHLKRYLAEFSETHNRRVELQTTEDDKYSITAISSGAVLAALNKDAGPARIAQSSYGFLRTQDYERGFEPHAHGQHFRDDVDGKDYIYTIVYFMIKGDTVPAKQKFLPQPCCHTFPVDMDEFLCEEVVYVSDTATASSYPLESKMNRNAQIAGKIVFDMTNLIRNKTIKVTQPVYGQGQPHYRVDFDMVASVEGRSLKYEARRAGKVVKRGHISLAGAFRAGTA